MVRPLAVDMVASGGYKVYEAGNADEAIALMEQHPDIRIVFTDVEMPGTMDGIKLAHYIRHRWPPILLIVTSGAVRLSEKDLPIGAAFLHKPYERRDVTDRLFEMVTRINTPQ